MSTRSIPRSGPKVFEYSASETSCASFTVRRLKLGTLLSTYIHVLLEVASRSIETAARTCAYKSATTSPSVRCRCCRYTGYPLERRKINAPSSRLLQLAAGCNPSVCSHTASQPAKPSGTFLQLGACPRQVLKIVDSHTSLHPRPRALTHGGTQPEAREHSWLAGRARVQKELAERVRHRNWSACWRSINEGDHEDGSEAIVLACRTLSGPSRRWRLKVHVSSVATIQLGHKPAEQSSCLRRSQFGGQHIDSGRGEAWNT